MWIWICFLSQLRWSFFNFPWHLQLLINRIVQIFTWRALKAINRMTNIRPGSLCIFIIGNLFKSVRIHVRTISVKYFLHITELSTILPSILIMYRTWYIGCMETLIATTSNRLYKDIFVAPPSMILFRVSN